MRECFRQAVHQGSAGIWRIPESDIDVWTEKFLKMHRSINVLSQDYLFYESWEYISKQYKEEGHR